MPWNAKSLLFGGVDEIVLVGNVLVYGTPDRFSISAWVKTTNAVGQTIVAKQGAGTPYGWQLALDSSGRVFFEMVYTSAPSALLSVTSTQAIKDGAWHHVVSTWNGNASPGYTGAKLYIDGALQTLASFTDTLGTNNVASTASLAIGCRNTGSDTMPFVGNIDEVAIYNKVLTASEVTWLYNSGRPQDLLVSGAPSNLVGWWRMGDGDVFPVVSDHSPTFIHPSVKDSSGGGYTGTMTNMESTDAVLDVPGRTLFSAGSVLFGGTDEYVTMGDVLSFERTQAFTLSCWVRYVSAPGMLFAKSAGFSTYQGYQLYLYSAGDMNFTLYSNYSGGSGQYMDTTSAVSNASDGSWHHVAVTYNGDSVGANVQFYVDGAPIGKTVNHDNLASTIITTAPLCLGGHSNLGSANNFAGNIDEAAVHSRALSAAEISWIYNSGLPRDLYASGAPFDLAAWWRMGDGDVYSTLRDYGPRAVYPSVRDLSGSNYTGTMTNMEVADLVSDTPGKSAPSMKSVLFGGTDEYATMGNILAFEYDQACSFSCWFKTTGRGEFVSKLDTVPRGYCFYTANGRIVAQWLNSGTNLVALVTTASGFNDNNWRHACLTKNTGYSASGGAWHIYVDGVDQALTINADTLTATILTSVAFMVGSDAYSAPDYFTGSLDEVSIYSKALSAAEVTWIYNGGTPRALTDSGCPSDLAAWWKMGDGDTFPTLLDSGPGGWVNPYPTITDYSGSGYTGTMTNMETTDVVIDAPTAPTGLHSTAFEGTNEYVDMGDVLGFERTDPFTFAFWAKYTSTSQMTVLAKMYADTPFTGYNIMLLGGQIYVELLNTYMSNWLRVVTTGTFNDGAWHHVIVTYTGSSVAAGVKVYVDNVERSTTINADSLTASILTSVPFNLGIRNLGVGSYTGPFVGQLNNVGIWNRVLSSDDRVAVYGGLPSVAPSGLIGWWRMGEGSIGPLNGTMTNMESTDIVMDSPFQGAFARRSLLFDGVNEYVDFGNVLAFERTSPMSFSFWAKHSVSSSWYYVLEKQASGTPQGWAVQFSYTGSLAIQITNTWATNCLQVRTTGTDWADGVWHHFVVTYDGSSTAAGVKMYVDGSLQLMATVYDTLSATIINTATLKIGGSTLDTPHYFPGNLDEVAAYNRALSQAEVTWTYNGGVPRDLKGVGAPLNLVAWWRLGEGAHPGTMTNMESTDLVAEAPVPSTFATKSLLFDGVNEYVDFGNVLAFERTSPMSFSFWAKHSVSSSWYYVLDKQVSGTPQGWTVFFAYTGSLTLRLSNTYATSCIQKYTTGANWADGAWHHFVVTYNGSSSASGVVMYVDGVLWTMTTVFDNLSATIANTTSLKIGGNTSDTPHCFPGFLDEVSVYNKVLSPQEVSWIYNGGVPRDLQAPTAPSNLVAWWRLGEAGLPGTMTNMESPDIVADALGTDENQRLTVPTVEASETGGGEGSDDTAIPMTIPVNPTRYYKMRARDSGAAPPGYVTWVVVGDPDFAGSGYSGGSPTPIGAMVVGSVVLADEWR
jgi:hypothetical protein